MDKLKKVTLKKKSNKQASEPTDLKQVGVVDTPLDETDDDIEVGVIETVGDVNNESAEQTVDINTDEALPKNKVSIKDIFKRDKKVPNEAEVKRQTKAKAAKEQRKKEKKYLRNGDNHYPYASLSQLLWKFQKFEKWFMLGTLIMWGINYGLYFVFQGFVYGEGAYDSLLRMSDFIYRSGFARNPDGFAVGMKNIADFFTKTKEFGYWWPLFKMFLIIFIAIHVLHLITILLRKHNHELQPFANDSMARKIKNSAIERLNSGTDINPETDRKGNEMYKYKNEDEHNALRAIRNMNIQIRTRRALKGDKYYTEGSVVIRMPHRQDSRMFLMNKIKDMVNILGAGSEGVYAFGEGQQGADQRFLTYAFERDVTDEYREKAFNSINFRKKIFAWAYDTDVEESDAEKEEIRFTFDLDIFGDNSEKIREAQEGAIEYTKKQRRSLDMYFATQASGDSGGRSSGVSLAKMDAGNTSAQYRYSLAGTSVDPQKAQKDLEISLNTRGISVYLDAGDLIVNVPYPSEISIPQDTKTMILEAFG